MKIIRESLNERRSYSSKPKGLIKALGDLGDSLDYLSKAEDEDHWFLEKNPDIKRIVSEMNDLYYELGDHLDRIDWGQTDWQNLKKWKWNTPRSYNAKAPGSASNI